MLETPHVVVGAAIATKVTNPLLSVPLSFVSHFLLEKIPHWNPHLRTETLKYGKPTKKSTIIAFTDVSISLITGLFIAYRALPEMGQTFNILLCCLAASLPDIIEGPYFFLGIRDKTIKKWIDWQSSIQADSSFLLGILTQLVVLVTALYSIFT